MKLRSIELLRGLAALVVVLSHSSTTIANHPALHFGSFHGGLIIPGGPGVEFFFVLSGFEMMTAHGHQVMPASRVGAFFWRRFIRIYPLFWLVMAELVWRYWGAPSITWASVLNWCSLAPVSDSNLLVVAWTLRQEVVFYAMFGLALSMPQGWIVLALWAAGIVGYALVPSLAGGGGQVARFVFSPFTIEFFAGLAAGWAFRRGGAGRFPQWVWAGALASGAALLAWRMSLDGWGMQYGPFGARFAYGAAYGLIVTGLAGLERAGVYRLGRVAAFAGAISYPLYLSHLTALHHLGAWAGSTGFEARIGPDVLFAAFVVAALGLATVLAYAVDRPLQRLLRSLAFADRAPGLFNSTGPGTVTPHPPGTP